MSTIQRYSEIQTPGGACLIPRREGEYCAYADLHWYRRQYRLSLMVVVVVVVACGVLAVLLAQEYAERTPSAAMVQRHADTRIEQAEQQYQARKAEVERLHRNLDQVSGKLDGAMKLNANLAAQIRALNALTDPAQQLDALRAAAR